MVWVQAYAFKAINFSGTPQLALQKIEGAETTPALVPAQPWPKPP
jgi:hypothetical protein